MDFNRVFMFFFFSPFLDVVILKSSNRFLPLRTAAPSLLKRPEYDLLIFLFKTVYDFFIYFFFLTFPDNVKWQVKWFFIEFNSLTFIFFPRSHNVIKKIKNPDFSIVGIATVLFYLFRRLSRWNLNLTATCELRVRNRRCRRRVAS